MILKKPLPKRTNYKVLIRESSRCIPPISAPTILKGIRIRVRAVYLIALYLDLMKDSARPGAPHVTIPHSDSPIGPILLGHHVFNSPPFSIWVRMVLVRPGIVGHTRSIVSDQHGNRIVYKGPERRTCPAL